MTNNYAVELRREDVEGKRLKFALGLCAADLEKLNQPRDYVWFLENVIRDRIIRGIIDNKTNTPYDDRKLRYNTPRIIDDKIYVPLGVTDFQAFKGDLEKTEIHKKQLKIEGEDVFADEFAFFSRPLGVAVLPISADGSIFLGERENEEYGGFLNAAAGYLDFRDPRNVNPFEDVLRELDQEFGIKRVSIDGNPEFVGIVYHPINGDLDLTYIVKTKIHDRYFTSGDWKERVMEKEHKNLIQMSTMPEVQRLLSEGMPPKSDKKYELMYSTRLALESLYPHEIRN